MFETDVSLSSVIAFGLWTLTLSLILSGTLVALTTDHLAFALALMAHGLACSAAAATATVRGYFISQNRLLTEAFELGRESAGATPLRNRG